MSNKSILKRIANWETWPFYIIYSPLVFLWGYYAIRSKRFWFFSNINPSLEFAGFEGDSKKPMYSQLPEDLYPRTIYINHTEEYKNVFNRIVETGLTFPLAVKPNIGAQGLLFRKINDEKQLKIYHEKIGVEYIAQQLINLPVEVSVFHIRYPHAAKGIITGFIEKEYMHVVGDGRSTLLQLILKHPKAVVFKHELLIKHARNLEVIVEEGSVYNLNITGNHNRGARFINLRNEINADMLQVFDNLSLFAKNFYYGRYDIKTSSIADLKQGKNFSILEYNGAGAEPNHIYDCNMSYARALKEIAIHWGHMYKIGRINYRNGIRYLTFFEGMKMLTDAKKLFKKLNQQDLELVIPE